MQRGAALAALVAITAGAAVPAAAQDIAAPAVGGGGGGGGISSSSGLTSGLRPAYGLGTRVGDLRAQLEGLVSGGAPLPAGIAWQVIPSIGVDVGATDNASFTNGRQRADVFTQITPGVVIIGDTPRVNVNLSYTPLARLYASTPSQNRFDQYLNAGAQVTILPERLLIDARAQVSQQSLTGGFGQDGFSQGTLSDFNRQDQVQSATVEVTPRFVNRFGSLGTAELSYTLAYTNQNYGSGSGFGGSALGAPLGSSFGSGFGTTNQAFGARDQRANAANQGFFPQDLLTHRERATFTTGEDLGRVRSFLLLEAVQFDGAGPYRGAYRREASADNAFALNRTVSLLGKIGYQQILYNGLGGYRFSGITWNAGVRLTPNVEDFIELRYGEQDGTNNFTADMSYAPTARIRLLARYDTGITSNVENQQNLLSGTTVNQFGGSVDTLTGGPVTGTSGFFGTQNNIFELRRLSFTGIYTLPRDTISVSVVREERSPPSNNRGGFGQNLTGYRGDNGIYGTVNWQHELADDWRTNLSVQVGTRSAGRATGPFAAQEASSASERTLSTVASTSYQLSPTLGSQASYVFNQRSGGGSNRSFTENILIVGLRKTF